ncbi:MAG: DUF3823 domain-containing protein [Candidatus Pseudobacter hemicellulosilyticus]|uniref:DUF3823 domain-containing protein n=1 Tax=Candidatus Pseudobacter hemicellulosilyticus TaxID=3121375 RepID=A0AAJ6BHM4_9BACT|nr:MAG: DUF3823 domain-containing protein [Pseudobacter sp.]
MTHHKNTWWLGLWIVTALFSSCIKKDNYDGPNASLEGNLLVAGTKDRIQTASGNIQVRLEQLSWSETPSPQTIPGKMDGSYKNSKLFKGHYRVTPIGGAFWPMLPVEIDIDANTQQDFELIPYVFINNLQHELEGSTLTLNFDISAPVEVGMPPIIEVQPYVNTTKMVGPGASIYDFSDAFKDVLPTPMDYANMTPADKSRELKVEGLLPGRTYFVRVGVRFNDSYKSSNLSEIIEIQTPPTK